MIDWNPHFHFLPHCGRRKPDEFLPVSPARHPVRTPAHLDQNHSRDPSRRVQCGTFSNIGRNDEKTTTIFRELIQSPEILILPCCHDGLSAKALEQAGFKAIAAAGYGLAGSLLGMPDISVLTAFEMIAQYRNICSAVNIPVFVDIDTGFGDVNNVIRAVKECEKAGVAGLFLEDQTYPKRCGHMEGKTVVPVEEYLPKLKAALWAREDPDFVITARTDSFAVHGIGEAVRRAGIYAETGADMVFVEAVFSREDMRKVNTALAETHIPSMANMIEGGRPPAPRRAHPAHRSRHLCAPGRSMHNLAGPGDRASTNPSCRRYRQG